MHHRTHQSSVWAYLSPTSGLGGQNVEGKEPCTERNAVGVASCCDGGASAENDENHWDFFGQERKDIFYIDNYASLS